MNNPVNNQTVTFLLGYCLIIVASATLAFSQTCPNLGATDRLCGSGLNECVGSDATVCTADTAKILAPGKFQCSQVTGKKNCRVSDTFTDECFCIFRCTYDPMRMFPCDTNPLSGDCDYDPINVDDSCPAG